MKNLSKIMPAMVFLSLAIAFCAYAEETETAETVNTPAAQMPEAPSAPQTVVAAIPQAAETVTPEAVPPAPVEKTTLDNLQAAFNGESNAHAWYLAFAQKADAEGYARAASLFRAASRAEQVHFERHAKVIKKMGGTPTAHMETPVVKSTAENIKSAMESEIYENTVVYPEFLAKAKKDNNKGAIDAFEDAGAAEGVHAKLYKQALGDLTAWKGKGKNFYVCPVCGNVMENMKFRNCPICDTKRKEFLTVK
jgi:rubrerythrin